MKLLLASNNAGKVKELRALLAGLQVELLSPIEAGISLQVEEHGETYLENASLKALAFAREAGMLSLADDSGLEVDALDGAPGLHSARFSPLPGAGDAHRRSYLLAKLALHPRPWTARFRCTVALATPAGKIRFTEGACAGEIIPEERGLEGFGYDPIFYIPDMGRTMAELSLEEKNRISHRARAVTAARPVILTMLQGHF